MIVDSFELNNDCENAWCNIYIEPSESGEKTIYVVGIVNAGEQLPSQEDLKKIALSAETITPFDEPLSLESLCSYIRDAIHSGTCVTPFLIPEQFLEMNVPANCYEEGVADAARGLHHNANPHIEGTVEADDWNAGWLVGRKGDLEDLKH